MAAALWSYRLAAPAVGIALARESGHVVAWDTDRWLVLVNRRGQPQAKVRAESALVAAAVAVDGSALADVDDRGVVTWRTPDLSRRWQHRLNRRPTALALDALGRVAAVADTTGAVTLFTSDGRLVGPPITLARAAHQLALADTSSTLFAAGDYGLVAAVDLGTGTVLWQDTPVVHHGSAVALGDPCGFAVACYSEGVRRYALTGKPLPPLPTPEPCRHVAATYASDRFLVGGAFGGLALVAADGTVRWTESLKSPAAGVALTPLGETAVVATGEGKITARRTE